MNIFAGQSSAVAIDVSIEVRNSPARWFTNPSSIVQHANNNLTFIHRRVYANRDRRYSAAFRGVSLIDRVLEQLPNYFSHQPFVAEHFLRERGSNRWLLDQ